MLLRCLGDRDSDIEEVDEAGVLPSVKDYLARFEHAYWANLVKVCVEKTGPCLIGFMELFNDLTHLVRI